MINLGIELLAWVILWYISVMLMSGLNTIFYRWWNFRRIGDRRNCYCDYCGAVIRPRWIPNFPIINYIWIRGKSRCCERRVSVIHPISEVMGGSALYVTGLLILAVII